MKGASMAEANEVRKQLLSSISDMPGMPPSCHAYITVSQDTQMMTSDDVVHNQSNASR